MHQASTAAMSIVLADASQLARQTLPSSGMCRMAIENIFQGRGQQGRSSVHH